MNHFNDLFIRTKQDLEDAVQTFGFVPFFKNAIPGFSIAEHVAKEAWFGEEEGVWEWKGPVIRETGCAYGKLFEKKAAYVSRELFPDLANYRRDGYDFDARYDDGLARFQDKLLFDLLEERAPVLSKELRLAGGYAYSGRGQSAEGRKGFDASIARLQEQCYVIISDFVYTLDKQGRPRGWGVAEYTTPERFWGERFRERVYAREPEESRARLLEHLARLFPQAGEAALTRFLR